MSHTDDVRRGNAVESTRMTKKREQACVDEKEKMETIEIHALREKYIAGSHTPRGVIENIYDAIARHNGKAACDLTNEDNEGNIWITRKSKEDVLRYVEQHFENPGGRFFHASKTARLFGVPFAVKDNIDVDGMQTTCACEGFASSTLIGCSANATCVQKVISFILMGSIHFIDALIM